MSRNLIIVGGPTGSGKSALALALALEFNGAIVNADAMQVYDTLPILTNRPGPEDFARAPHRLFGILPPSETCSAGRWRALAIEACESAWRKDLIPVVCGGTGLYIHALLKGIAPMPDIPADVREATRALLVEIGTPELHARLAARDPEMAKRLRPSDPQRIARAWEVLEATGKSLAEWQATPTKNDFEARVFSIFVDPPREQLYAACDARFVAMVERGALDEVRTFLALKLAADLPAMKVLGVSELGAHLSGKLSLAEATAKAQTATRHYAKRQYTWFRHQWTPDLALNAQLSERSSNEIFTKIRESLLTRA